MLYLHIVVPYPLYMHLDLVKCIINKLVYTALGVDVKLILIRFENLGGTYMPIQLRG